MRGIMANASRFTLLLATTCIAACGSDGSTAGRRIVLHTAMSSSAPTSFTTGFGWDVALTKAAVASTSLYYFDGPPPTARFDVPPMRFFERIESLVIKSAWAHPGHYQAGTALGQVIFPQTLTLDLFAPDPALPDGAGVTGTYRSARFAIPNDAPSDAALGGHIAIAEGKALKHGDASGAPIYFRLVADVADIAANVNNGAVDGCVLDETNVESDGTITLAVSPAVWLNLVDFSKVAPGTVNSPTEFHDAGFSQGVAELSAYHFSYSK